MRDAPFNTSMREFIAFLHEIGTIMYVGGILSHIVIGAMFAHSDPQTTVTVYAYKLQSAYILILPGLALKVVTDLILWFGYRERAWWMRIKLACTAFLTVNAFVFLVPMMPQLLALAEAAIPEGQLSKAFLDLEHREKLVGMSNVIPLVTEMLMTAALRGVAETALADPWTAPRSSGMPDGIVEVSINGSDLKGWVEKSGHLWRTGRGTPPAKVNARLSFDDIDTAFGLFTGTVVALKALGRGKISIRGKVPMIQVLFPLLDRFGEIMAWGKDSRGAKS